LGLGDLFVVHHAGEGHAERGADVLVGYPGGFFPAHRGGVGVGVGGVEDLFGEEFEPLAEPCRHCSRADHQGLLGEVEVDVWFLQEGADFVDEGPASVEEDEVGVAEAGVVEEGFEEEGVVAGYVEVASAA